MNKLPISFEFSAPKTADATAALLRSQDRLKGFDPEYVSVTYGAGGSTRDGTKEAAIALGQGAVPVAPHLSLAETRRPLFQRCWTNTKKPTFIDWLP